jgi:transposase InsO family protein
MLGYNISERSVSRWMRHAPRTLESDQSWLTFLRNHREVIAAMDFFSVPTLTFKVLYVFFIISHDRRRILHFNVMRHPTSIWIVQQLREAFPYEPPVRFLLLNHDSKYGIEKFCRDSTAVGCPWQNGVAERWVGSCRRDLLDHLIAINQSHLKRLLAAYVDCYHRDRIHCGLQKQTPVARTRCVGRGKVSRGPVSEAFTTGMNAQLDGS